MSYIYAITNNINQKQYVGKTDKTPEERFSQHINDSKKEQNQVRPLYRAFLKYGVENFTLSILEECSRQDSSAREIYWIGKLNTYKDGYNATLGGDGKSWRDYKSIAEKYKEFHNVSKVADFFGCDQKTVRLACKEYSIPIRPSSEITKEYFGKSVNMLDLDGKFIRHFVDMTEAGRYLIELGVTKAEIRHISAAIGRVANGKRKTAYGYLWTFA